MKFAVRIAVTFLAISAGIYLLHFITISQIGLCK